MLVGGVAAGVLTGHRIRRMRATATTVRPLDHDVDLPGAAPPRRLVVLGDSAAAGHGLHDADEALARRVGRGLVARDGRATTVRCVAVDGATTAGVLATQLDAACGAEVVIVGVGVNDATRPSRRVTTAAAQLGALLVAVQARKAPGGRVVLLSCPDLSVAPGLPTVLRPVMGVRCRALATAQASVAGHLGVEVITVPRSVLSAEVFGPDGFHPGVVGHARLADDVVERLTTTGG